MLGGRGVGLLGRKRSGWSRFRYRTPCRSGAPQGHQTVHRGQFGLNDRAPKGGGKAHLILQFPVNPRIPRQECEQRAEAHRRRIRPCGNDGCRSEQYVVGGIDFTRGRMFGVHELVQHLRQREARVRAMSMGVIVGKHDEVRNSHLF